jgi:L-fucose mutarotase
VLKGIDPLITPELIKLLMEMGHDDAIVVADANFTAMSLGAGKPVLRLPGAGMVHVIRAIDSVMALAADVVHPVAFMQVSGTEAPYLSGLQREVLGQLQASMLPHQTAESVERYAFYERTRQACAIVVTGELQPFGNFILRKGAIGENLRP